MTTIKKRRITENYKTAHANHESTDINRGFPYRQRLTTDKEGASLREISRAVHSLAATFIVDQWYHLLFAGDFLIS